MTFDAHGPGEPTPRGSGESTPHGPGEPTPEGESPAEGNAEDAGIRESTSWKERERRRAREVILTAAADLFAEFGFEKTSVRQIADRAKLSVGKLYLHFEGKEDIFREILQGYLKDLNHLIDTANNPDQSPLEQIRCQLAAATNHLKESSKLIIIFVNENPLMLEGLIKKEIMHYRATLAGLFACAMEQGEIRREDPDAVAAILLGAIHRLTYWLVDSGHSDALDTAAPLLDRIILKPLEMHHSNETGSEDE